MSKLSPSIAAQLTPDEWERLLTITLSSNSAFRHDLRSAYGGIANAAHYFLEDDFDAKPEELLESRKMALRVMEDCVHKADILIWQLATPYERQTLFRTDLDSLISLARSRFGPAVTVVRLPVDSESCVIPYPSQAIMVLVSELIANALKHNPAQDSGSAIALVDWSVTDNEFRLSVHDNGPLVVPHLADNYIALTQRTGLKDLLGEGLRSIYAFLIASNGRLRARRSPKLSGSEVTVAIPILGRWIGDSLRRGDFRYED